MQNLDHFDGRKENMGLKTTDAMVQSQHDCLVVRVGQKAEVETQESVQFLSDGHRSRSFQKSFRDASECSNHRNEKKQDI